MRIILASNSPRRARIVRDHGFVPTIVLPACNEHLSVEEQALPPAQIVELLALRKARDVYERLVGGTLFCPTCTIPYNGLPKMIAESVILGADTVVVKDGILGKPAGHDSAVAMLERLRATAHEVYTGVALIQAATGEEFVSHDVSTVVFGDYTLAEIEEFLEQEPPYDKAGSYALQGIWAAHIKHIEGDRENVIGLPFHLLEPYLTDEAS
jgi:septum formation protein